MSFPTCPFYLAAFICIVLGLLLGVRAIFRIRESRGRLRGYGHAILAVIFSTAALFGLFSVVFMVRGVRRVSHFDQHRPSPDYRGKSAAEHGPRCPEIVAAGGMSSDFYRCPALKAIAESDSLSTHEQMHLVDVVFDDFDDDFYRRTVLVGLASNPVLTAQGRAYLAEQLKWMPEDFYRRPVLKALEDSRPPPRPAGKPSERYQALLALTPPFEWIDRGSTLSGIPGGASAGQRPLSREEQREVDEFLARVVTGEQKSKYLVVLTVHRLREKKTGRPVTVRLGELTTAVGPDLLQSTSRGRGVTVFKRGRIAVDISCRDPVEAGALVDILERYYDEELKRIVNEIKDP